MGKLRHGEGWAPPNRGYLHWGGNTSGAFALQEYEGGYLNWEGTRRGICTGGGQKWGVFMGRSQVGVLVRGGHKGRPCRAHPSPSEIRRILSNPAESCRVLPNRGPAQSSRVLPSVAENCRTQPSTPEFCRAQRNRPEPLRVQPSSAELSRVLSSAAEPSGADPSLSEPRRTLPSALRRYLAAPRQNERCRDPSFAERFRRVRSAAAGGRTRALALGTHRTPWRVL